MFSSQKQTSINMFLKKKSTLFSSVMTLLYFGATDSLLCNLYFHDVKHEAEKI